MRDENVRIAKYDAKFEAYEATGALQSAVRSVKGLAVKAATKIGVYSPSETPCTPKVLMVVGATGAGKTTLINGLVNYVLGITWEDDFRFKLISEVKTRSDAYSQTSWITAYNIPIGDGSRFRHPLTIIDTPGFGDTDGVERDKKIAGQIKEFFSLPPPNGIDHIDGIGFVAQASQARLTQAQNYIFQSILAIFGKDIGGNIFMMTTFADGGRACVLDSIREAKIPFVESFKFNNSALYEKSDDSAFDKLFWEMGIKSFHSALSCFQTVTPKSLQLTKEVLRERESLELVIQNVQKKVQIAMDKIGELQQEQHIMKQHEQDIDANKNFTYELDTYKIEKNDVEPGYYVTNCANCSFTCHYPCGIASDSGKIGCAAITNGQCTSCPKNCHWSSHFNNGYYLVTRKVKETRTYDDLKERYDQAKSGKSAKENIIKKMEEELHELHAAVLVMVREAKQSLNRLKEIALKPDPLTEIQYIDILIESEKHKGGPGSLNRIKCLEKIRDQAQLMMSIELKEQQLQNYGGTQWWDVLRKT